MKKEIKKTIKKVKEMFSTPKQEEVKETKTICPSCKGSGLWRPDYVNSPQCETCVGHGFI